MVRLIHINSLLRRLVLGIVLWVFLLLTETNAAQAQFAQNAKRTLYGENLGDGIVLQWVLNDNAAEYFTYRSTSLKGPWKQILRTSQDAAATGGAKEDLTPDASLMDLCYRVEAIDATGRVIENYESICVPKFVSETNPANSSSISSAGEGSQNPRASEPEEILRKLIPELPGLKMVTPKDLEPNSQGKYRRHAFIQGDFNRDGQEDIAIAAIGQSTPEGRPSYVLIASRSKDGNWTRVFFHKFWEFSKPFLIWDSKGMRLLVGANQSDFNPGDIVWDRKTKKYKVVKAKDN